MEITNNLGKIKIGESISVNGVCSTVKKNGKIVIFEYMPESLKLSNLSLLHKGDLVNIEQSIRINDRLNGHIVLETSTGKGKLFPLEKKGIQKYLK